MPRAGVIFDVDGTLVDTNYLHTLAWWRAFRDEGHDVPMSAIHRLIGMTSDRLVEELLGEFEEPVKEGHTKYFRELKSELTAFGEAGKLLDAVHERGGVVVLATSAKPEDIEDMLEAIGASEDSIAEVTDSSQVEKSKPDPESFEKALEAADLEPENALVVGDTVWDVGSAKGAGLECVAVLTGGISRQELEEAGAVAVYGDVGELLAELDDSPIGRLLAERT